MKKSKKPKIVALHCEIIIRYFSFVPFRRLPACVYASFIPWITLRICYMIRSLRGILKLQTKNK